MSTCVMVVEGVLGDRDVFDVTMQQNDTASRLYFSLQQWFRLVLVTSAETEKAEHWLRSQGLGGHAAVLGISNLSRFSGMENIDIRASQLRSIRANRTAVELVVDSDPLVVTMAAAQGIAATLFVPGRVGTARTDLHRRRRDWGSIEAEIGTRRTSRPVQTAETP